VATCSGKEFQIWGAAAGKARLPTVDKSDGNGIYTRHAGVSD